jgi:ubiquinol-cytochrome c reductase cytochrome c subunit
MKDADGEPGTRLGRRTVLAMAAAVLAVSVPVGLLLAPHAAGLPRAAVTTSPSAPAVTPTSPGGAVSPSASSSPAPAPTDVAAGKELYEERCSTCHGSAGEGTFQGPPIAGLGPAYYDFMMSTGRMPLDQPGVQARPRPPVLRPDEIRAISDYLQTVAPGGVPIPHVNPLAGDLSLGEETYQGNCAPCHGIAGRGGAVGPQIAPPLIHTEPTQVAEAVRIGPGAMPVFDEGTIDQHTLDSVVAYVVYLRHPDDRGGSGLGGVGPLVEGFVALFGGLGLIVLVTRTIGTRS